MLDYNKQRAPSLDLGDRNMLRFIVCVSAFLVSSAAMSAGSSLPYSGGGVIGAGRIIAHYNKTGELFKIEGRCQSSCTRLLAIRNVCVDPNATLLFHAALLRSERGERPNPQRQAIMLSSYNAKLRNYLVRGGHVDGFEFHAISGSDIINKFGYRACR